MSNELIVYAPKDSTFDYDYVAFSFNGKNSYDDFGIYRTSDNGRYNLPLIPELSDQTADTVGADGQYYFSTYHKKKTFTVNFAFDRITESQLREFKRWLNGKEIAPLWFAENPYKVYQAKVTGQVSFSALPFDDDELKRVYKGNGSVQFTCYYPYARTPDKVQIWSASTNTWRDQTNKGSNGKSLLQYEVFANCDEWAAASGLTNSPIIGENFGDLPAPFELSTKKEIAKNTVLSVGNQSITILEDCGQDSDFVWNSRTGAVTALFSGKRRAVNFSGDSLATIPVTAESGITEFKAGTQVINNSTDWTIKYHYWYY